jgi:hypothetical protein
MAITLSLARANDTLLPTPPMQLFSKLSWPALRAATGFLCRESLRSSLVRIALLGQVPLVTLLCVIAARHATPIGAADLWNELLPRIVEQVCGYGGGPPLALVLSLSVFATDRSRGVLAHLCNRGLGEFYGLLRLASTAAILCSCMVLTSLVTMVITSLIRPGASLQGSVHVCLHAVLLGITLASFSTALLGPRNRVTGYAAFALVLAGPEWLFPITKQFLPGELTSLSRMVRAASGTLEIAGIRAFLCLVFLNVLAAFLTHREAIHFQRNLRARSFA